MPKIPLWLLLFAPLLIALLGAIAVLLAPFLCVLTPCYLYHKRRVIAMDYQHDLQIEQMAAQRVKTNRPRVQRPA